MGLLRGLQTLRSEIFKSKKVLEATLHDDLSVINLTLRRNNTFEVSAINMFSEEKFTGKYKIDDDKIIFLTRPYDNELIPDTVKILNDKIILKFEEDNQPVLDFADYFDITQNNLKNSP